MLFWMLDHCIRMKSKINHFMSTKYWLMVCFKAVKLQMMYEKPRPGTCNFCCCCVSLLLKIVTYRNLFYFTINVSPDLYFCRMMYVEGSKGLIFFTQNQIKDGKGNVFLYILRELKIFKFR